MRLPYDRPIIRGTLVQRYKRFLADVRLEGGSTITAMCANTGSMATCNEPGRPVLLSDSENPERKYRYTWEAIHMGDAWVNVNTGLPNRAVEQFIRAGAIAELAGYPFIRREVKYGADGRSRIDLLLTNEAPPKKRKKDPDPRLLCEPTDAPDCYVEIKNTSMRDGRHSIFPDAVTTRGQKHLIELTELAKAGTRAAMFYFCGRADTRAFRPADEIDPEYGRLLRVAAETGVAILPYRVNVSPEGIALAEPLPVEI